MTRKRLNPSIQASVLLRSRRRCCICFGLNRDTFLKQGQIAHLDRDNANDSEDNLAFLCFEHHDIYDSKTSQSKNFTPEEVKQYQKELHNALKLAFSSEISFGNVSAILFDPSGHYIRNGEYESAEIIVKRIDNDRLHVSGLALYGIERQSGPNMGDLDFVTKIRGNIIDYEEDDYLISLRFLDEGLSVIECNWCGHFGLNVRFTGEYLNANSDT